MLEERTKIPVVGTVPMLSVDIEEEDSISERLERGGSKAGQKGAQKAAIDIAVIRFPKISNYTDLAPLESVEGVEVRYVSSPRDLGQPDLILLPGSKNAMGDLKWMRTSGMEASVFKCLKKDTMIFGICGGYQMMGESLADPEGTEGGGTMRGMGLLPVETVFYKQKTRTRIQGKLEALSGMYKKLSGAAYEGYEIHMGETALKGDAKPSTNIQDSVTGERKADGAYLDNVCGTYVHGVFDKEAVAEAIVQIIGEKKGLDVSGMTGMDFQAFKETQYDILAYSSENQGCRRAAITDDL